MAEATLADLVDLADAEGPWMRFQSATAPSEPSDEESGPWNLFRRFDAGDMSIVERQLTPGFLSTWCAATNSHYVPGPEQDDIRSNVLSEAQFVE